MNGRLIHFVLALMIALFMTTAGFGEDVIKLKDGRIYKGEIVSETEDYIEFKLIVGSIKQDMILFLSDIEAITRDSDNKAEGAGDAAGHAEGGADAAKPGPVTLKRNEGEPIDFEATANKRVFVIPMGDGSDRGMVGTYFRKDKLEEAIELARPYDPDVIVLLINSPGGYLSEVYKLRDYLQEVRDEFRIVAWIKSAISAAAMTSLNCREIYFMKEGHMGAATAWYGPGIPVQGKELEDWIEAARELAESAGHDPEVAQAMVHQPFELSCDREVLANGEVEVTWFENIDGEHVVCRDYEVLTLSATEADYYLVSHGIADDGEELAEFLNLDGWIEVSNEGRELMENWWALLDKAATEIPALYGEYQIYSTGSRSDVGRQIEVVRKLIRWCDKLGEVAEMAYGLNKAELERALKELLRALRR